MKNSCCCGGGVDSIGVVGLEVVVVAGVLYEESFLVEILSKVVRNKLAMYVGSCPRARRRWKNFMVMDSKSRCAEFWRLYFDSRPWIRLFSTPGGCAECGGM